jgi:hypothetical protein
VPTTAASAQCVQRLTAAALRLEAGEDPGRLLGPGGPARSTGVPAADLARAALRHRVTGVLHAHAEDLGLALAFGDGLVEWLEQDHATTARGVAVQLLELGRALSALEERGIPVLALKGPALAVQTAGSVLARGYGDLDLFVAPGSVEAARAVLLEQGWHPRTFGSAPPGTWAWRHLLRTFNEIAFDGRASSVDLHWRLDPTPGALPHFADAWARRDLVPVDGLPGPAGTPTPVPTLVPALGPRDAFVHSCWHAAKDEWKWLRSLVDVHRLARRPEVWADWTEVRSDLDTRPVRNTLAVTEHLLGLPAAVPEELRTQRPSASLVHRADAWQLRDPRSGHPLPAAQSVRDLRHRLTVVRRPRAVVLAVTAVAIPAPSVAGIEDRSAWTAVPKLVLKRIGWLLYQSARWAWPRTRARDAVAASSDEAGRALSSSKALT